jgi:2-iminobutanoate/2-iminopropanoate deaminase
MSDHKKEVIIPAGGAKPVAPYSPAIRMNHLVFTSGQIGLDPATGKLIEGGLEAQTRQTLQNLQGVLVAAGSGMKNVLKTTVFLNDIRDYATVNAIYAEFFTEDPPARSAVQVAALPIGALVEIEAIAIAPEA